jgi:predicted small secreted protein
MKPIFLILTCALLPGCNLMRGVGQDMAAVGRTLTKVSGTEGGNQHQGPAAQPYDQSYEDQTYVEPSEVPQ